MRKATFRGITIVFALLFTASCIITPANGALDWISETVDSLGHVGIGCSITLDNLNHPWISYSNVTSLPSQLKVAHFTGSTWETSTVDTTGDKVTAIAVDAAGNPAIVYQDISSKSSLQYARLVGSSWQIETIDPACSESSGLSLVIDNAGKPHVSYIDNTDPIFPVLKYATYTGAVWSIEVVSDDCLPQEASSLQLDHTGNPCISFYNMTSGELVYTQRAGSIWLTDTVDSTGGEFPSLKLNSAGAPGISYFKLDGLHYAYLSGGTWYKETVDSSVGSSFWCSLAIDSASHPHISYYDIVNGHLKYAYYDGASWYPDTVDSSPNVGKYACLALDTYDNPCVCYFDEKNIALKYTHSAVKLSLTVAPESDGVGVLLVSTVAAIGCYFGIKRKTK